MEKRIQSLLLMLRIESCVSWIVVVIIFVLGILGVIVNGSVQPNTQKEFVLNTIGILSTLLVLPLALKLFLLNTTRSLRRMNHDEALDDCDVVHRFQCGGVFYDSQHDRAVVCFHWCLHYDLLFAHQAAHYTVSG